MNLSRESDGTFVANYGKPSIERPNVGLAVWSTPANIPPDVLPVLAKEVAVEEQALFLERQMKPVTRIAVFCCFSALILFAMIVTTFIPGLS